MIPSGHNFKTNYKTSRSTDYVLVRPEEGKEDDGKDETGHDDGGSNSGGKSADDAGKDVGTDTGKDLDTDTGRDPGAEAGDRDRETRESSGDLVADAGPSAYAINGVSVTTFNPSPVSLSSDLDNDSNARASGLSDPNYPLNVLDKNSAGSATNSDRNSPVPQYHLLTPDKLNFTGALGDIQQEYSGDALGYYKTPNAVAILLLGSDDPKEIFLGSSGTKWGIVGAALGVAIAAVLIPPAAPEAAELGFELAASIQRLSAIAEAGKAGFEIGSTGSEIYEFLSGLPQRASALQSLLHNFEGPAGTTTALPTPTPGPTPDMISSTTFYLK